MAESEEKQKRLLMRMKGETKKAGLNFNIQKTKITASSPITSWQIKREKVEAVTEILFYFIFLYSKITVDSDCRNEMKDICSSKGKLCTADGDCNNGIKRCLLFERKAMTNLDSVLKSRDITLLTKVCIVKAMFFFPVIVYGCENWPIKRLSNEELMLSNCGAGEDS